MDPLDLAQRRRGARDLARLEPGFRKMRMRGSLRTSSNPSWWKRNVISGGLGTKQVSNLGAGASLQVALLVGEGFTLGDSSCTLSRVTSHRWKPRKGSKPVGHLRFSAVFGRSDYPDGIQGYEHKSDDLFTTQKSS